MGDSEKAVPIHLWWLSRASSHIEEILLIDLLRVVADYLLRQLINSENILFINHLPSIVLVLSH